MVGIDLHRSLADLCRPLPDPAMIGIDLHRSLLSEIDPTLIGIDRQRFLLSYILNQFPGLEFTEKNYFSFGKVP